MTHGNFLCRKCTNTAWQETVGRQVKRQDQGGSTWKAEMAWMSPSESSAASQWAAMQLGRMNPEESSRAEEWMTEMLARGVQGFSKEI